MSKVKLKIYTGWEIRQTDLRDCSICNDQIFSGMYCLYTQITNAAELRINGSRNYSSNITICSTCKEQSEITAHEI